MLKWSSLRLRQRVGGWLRSQGPPSSYTNAAVASKRAQGRRQWDDANTTRIAKRQARRGDADARAIANDSGIVIVGDDYNE